MRTTSVSSFMHMLKFPLLHHVGNLFSLSTPSHGNNTLYLDTAIVRNLSKCQAKICSVIFTQHASLFSPLKLNWTSCSVLKNLLCVNLEISKDNRDVFLFLEDSRFTLILDAP